MADMSTARERPTYPSRSKAGIARVNSYDSVWRISTTTPSVGLLLESTARGGASDLGRASGRAGNGPGSSRRAARTAACPGRRRTDREPSVMPSNVDPAEGAGEAPGEPHHDIGPSAVGGEVDGPPCLDVWLKTGAGWPTAGGSGTDVTARG